MSLLEDQQMSWESSPCFGGIWLELLLCTRQVVEY